jgi:7,8-dihydropterin-6-yl-methyl-4-(beta-D-ribofuranosyl)aminobenzene 5'-phosphate synthase
MKIMIVYDNEAEPPYKGDWGFACLIESKNYTMLFDTGANNSILLRNMEKINVMVENIQAVMLSHDHWDHTGGLPGLIAIRSDLPVYKPTFSETPRKLFTGFYSTGTLKSWSGILEQSLVCESAKGVVVVTGCSHPGLENIIETAKIIGKIYAVIGGFHEFNKFEAIKDIPLVVPCHCTSHKKEIKKLFPEAHEPGGVGKIIEI